MKQKILKYLSFYLIGFGILFVLRLIYGIVIGEGIVNSTYTQTYYNNNALIEQNQMNSDISFTKTNYASIKRKVTKQIDNSNLQTVIISQKYEKIANLQGESSDFDKSEKEIRELIKKHNSIIQFEQNSGLKGNRYIELTIGVPPDNFDNMIEDTKKIGIVKTININKFDKTNEYKDLNAKRKSLEDLRNSLVALKKMTGKIDEYISLENRIYDIEKEIKNFGIKLGEYDEENELCTLKYSLKEINSQNNFFILKVVKNSLEWAIQYYGIFTLIVLLASISIFFILIIIEKLRSIAEKLFDRNEEKKEEKKS